MPQGNDIIDLTGLAADVFAESGSVTGTTLTIVLSDGSSFDVDMSTLTLPDEYVVSGAYSNISELLTLTMNLGAPVQVDLSEAGKDTYVESGEVVGNNLILYVGDGTGPVTPISIDISAIAQDTFLTQVNLDALSGILSFTMNDTPTTVHTVDIGAYVASVDTRVSSATFNCANDTIELRFNDASVPMVPIDMSCFLDGITDLERGGVAFDAAKTYIAGDVVTVAGKVYVSRTGVSTPPDSNPGDWQLVHEDERGGLGWSGTTIYRIGDIVSKNNLLYISQSPNTGTDPLSDPAIWREYNSVKHTATTGGSVGGGLHNPTGDVYPNTASETLGATWTISGLGDGVSFSYTAGALAGTTVKDGDTLTWSGGATGSEVWLHESKVTVSAERAGMAWSNVTDYFEGDIVTSTDGEMYQCILSVTATTNVPQSDETHWRRAVRTGIFDGTSGYNEGDMVAIGDDIYVAGPGGVDAGITPPNNGWLLATPDERGGIAWNSLETYSVGDVVTQIPGAGGTPEAYVSLADSNLNQDPETIDVFWKLLDTNGVANVVWDIDHTYTGGDMVAYDGDIWIAAGPTTPGVFIPGEWILATPDERGGMAWRNDEDYLIGDVITHLGYIYVATNTSNGSTPSGASADWDQIVSADSYLENGGIKWSNSTPYNEGDLVTHGFGGGFVYVAVRASTNINPGTNPDDWRYAGVVERGGLLWDIGTIYEIGDTAMDGTNGNLYYARDQLDDNIGMPPASSIDFWQPVTRGGIGWNVAVVYRIDDVVVDDATGYQYRALQGGPLNIGKRPSDNTDFWRLLTTSLVYDPAVPYEEGSIVIGDGPNFDLFIVPPGSGPTTPGTQPPASPWFNATSGKGIAYNAATLYVLGDIVSFDGDVYHAVGTSTGSTPDSNPLDWQRADRGGQLWDATTNYKLGDVATQFNKAYVALSDNTGNIPDEFGDTAFWKLDVVTVEDVLTSTSAINALSANMGRDLEDRKIEHFDYGNATVGGTAKFEWNATTQVLNIVTV